MLGQFAMVATFVGLVSSCRAPAVPILEASGSSRGRVLVENHAVGNAYGNLLLANFWHRLDDDCKRSIQAGCEVTSCSGVDLVPAESILRSVSVGALTLSGFTFLQQDGLTLEVPPYYSASPRPVRMWSGGETIVASAPGRELPAFNGRTTAPSPITASIAGCAAQSLCTIERSRPLELRWSAGDVGEVLVSLSLDEYMVQKEGNWPRRRLTQARCRFPRESSGANIEPGVLGLFRPSVESQYLSGSIEITRRSTGIASVDGGSISIHADWVAVRQEAVFR